MEAELEEHDVGPVGDRLESLLPEREDLAKPGGFDGELQARDRRGIGIDRHNPARPFGAANELASPCADVNDGLSPEVVELRQVREHQCDVGGHDFPYRLVRFASMRGRG